MCGKYFCSRSQGGVIKKKSETFSLSFLNSSIFPCFAAYSKDKDKEKKLDDESNSPTVPQSAFLGPTLWDKTLPYDGDTFQLEYMDLEEFLSENGIPPSPSQHDHSPHPPGLQPTSSAAPSVMDLSSRASAPIHPGIPPPNCVQSPMRPGKLPDGSAFPWGGGEQRGRTELT